MNKLFFSKTDCTGCHTCYNICPAGAIAMNADVEGFLYPQIDFEKCIHCDLCTKVCPINKEPITPNAVPDVFAAVCHAEEVRQNSSSGGIFPVLAAEILKRGGVVFGATLTEDCEAVTHCVAKNETENRKLCGSKYVQSRIGDTYKEAKEFLEKGVPVLFTGTPCQIAGLYAFLPKEYEHLYTQDLICHGAPSPLLFKKYVKEMATRVGEQPRAVFFRNKETGWRNFSLRMEFDKAPCYTKSLAEDHYLRGFMSDMFLRPSCYQCRYKTIARQADITLADFWGVERVHPELDDNKGISLVFIHTEKGRTLLRTVESQLRWIPSDLQEAVRYNPAMTRSATRPARRDVFMATLPKASYDKLFRRFLRPPLSVRVKRKVRRFLKRLLGRQ